MYTVLSVAQVFIAGLLVLFGVRFNYFYLPFVGTFVLGDFGVIVTIVWAVAVPNAVNLVDGLDGLPGAPDQASLRRTGNGCHRASADSAA